MTTTDRKREAPTMTIRRTPDTGDHVPAAPGFFERVCSAVAPGAVGDCVRPKDHTGDHQSADFWSWPDTMTPQEIDLGALSDALSFDDYPVTVREDGTFYITGPGMRYAPELLAASDEDGQHLPDTDADLMRQAAAQGWELLTGWTGQYGYNGPCMHASEFVGGALERHILETPGVYCVAIVDEEDGEADSWVIARLIDNRP